MENTNNKLIIISKQCTGKSKIKNILGSVFNDDTNNSRIKFSKYFTNDLELCKHPDYSEKYYYLDTQTIHNLFESKSLLTLTTNPLTGFYQGITFDEYDNSDIIFMTPNEFLEMNTELIREDTIVIWLDSTYESRLRYFIEEGYHYNFDNVESYENMYDNNFLDSFINILKDKKNKLSEDYVYFFENGINEMVVIIAVLINKNWCDKEKVMEMFNSI